MANKKTKPVQSNMITIGRARFSLLTDRMVRLEWAEDGVFEDRPTLSVANRRVNEVPHELQTKGDTYTITTGALKLAYRDIGNPFSKNNLSIQFKQDGKSVAWHPGASDTGNLGGTIRTLDGCRGEEYWGWDPNKGNIRTGHRIDYGKGLISRDGWALVDDSETIPLNTLDDGREWVAPLPEKKKQDWYFLAYGHDYRRALADAARVFGRQPLPPRYVFGYWYSKYWAYTDKEMEDIADRFDAMQVPIDIMVVDMDWHLLGWTGYSWERAFFPDPARFLKAFHERGLHITLNLHPADGVHPEEDAYVDMCRAMGMNPAKKETVAFNCTDPKYMDAYFQYLHHPQEDMGVDFWWMDWQQGTNSGMKDLDPLPWLNILHWRDMEQRNRRKRPLIFSRYGGIGAGRYPIGFSGDTHSCWESLAIQPYLTATAANVLYGYWSHDIGGHMGEELTPEMYTRWIQFGAYSPVLRTHASKNPRLERRIWKYPDPYSDVMANAIRRRYELVPYIYSECRKVYDTCVSLLYPMYLDDPENEDAYRARDQYMFGEHMIAAPVVAPVETSDDMAEKSVWLPKGRWWNVALGELVKGNQWNTRRYTIDEVPVFVPAGAVIPGQTGARRLEPGSYRNLLVTAYPGGRGEYTLYEDDGISQDYLEGKSASIRISQTQHGAVRRIVLHPAKGSFKGFLAKRSLEVRLPGCRPPVSVMSGKRKLKWSYDGHTATVIINVPSVNVTRGIKLDVRFESAGAVRAPEGFAGAVRRLEQAGAMIRQISVFRPLHRRERQLPRAAHIGRRLSLNPENYAEEMHAWKRDIKELPDTLKDYRRAVKNWPFDRKGMRNVLDKSLRIMQTALAQSNF